MVKKRQIPHSNNMREIKLYEMITANVPQQKDYIDEFLKERTRNFKNIKNSF